MELDIEMQRNTQNHIGYTLYFQGNFYIALKAGALTTIENHQETKASE